MEVIELQGINNVRDLGGYPTKDGRKIKPHNFIRGVSLFNATDADVNTLVNDYNVRTIVDLRTTTEINEKPNREHDKYKIINIKIFREVVKGITHESIADEIGSIDDNDDFRYCYQYFIDHKEPMLSFKKAIYTIFDKKEDEAIYWHCSEGKDRCGVVSVLVLAVLGCDKKTIYQDYCYTNVVNLPKAERIEREMIEKGIDPSIARRWYMAFQALPMYLDIVYNWIILNYGTLDNFVRDFLEISDERRKEIQDMYLE